MGTLAEEVKSHIGKNVHQVNLDMSIIIYFDNGEVLRVSRVDFSNKKLKADNPGCFKGIFDVVRTLDAIGHKISFRIEFDHLTAEFESLECTQQLNATTYTI